MVYIEMVSAADSLDITPIPRNTITSKAAEITILNMLFVVMLTSFPV
jgi:hypothetical protein